MESKILTLSWKRVILLILHYFLGYGFLYRQLGIYFTIKSDPFAIMILPSIQLTIYLFTWIVTVLLSYPLLKEGYRQFRKHFKEHLLLIGILILVTYFANFILSIFVSVISGVDTSQNQQAIEASSQVLPALTIFSTCIFAPIVEECVFRGAIFAKLRSKLPFLYAAVTSSLIFGSIHFLNSLMRLDFSDLPYLFVYTAIGMVMAYGYEKSRTIYVPIILHFLNNAFALLTMLL